MKSKTALKKQDIFSQSLNDLIVDCIQDIKGKDIVKLDLTALPEAPADYFIICGGESTTQIRAISENISKRIWEEMGLKPNHTEGLDGSRWILVDYFTTIVHIFHPDTRSFYEIEDLWSDAKVVQYRNL